MSKEMLLKMGFALLIGIVSEVSIRRRIRSEEKREKSLLTDRVYRPFMNPWVLPMYITVVGILVACLDQRTPMNRIWLGSTLFDIFFLMAGYYLVLIPAVPFLRKHFRASACAYFWCVPNILYFLLTAAGMLMSGQSPWKMIYIEREAMTVLFAVWGIVAAAILVWKITEHFLYRRYLLDGALPAEDPAVLAVWNEEKERVGEKS